MKTTLPTLTSLALALLASFAAACGSPAGAACDRLAERERRCSPSLPACRVNDIAASCNARGVIFRPDYIAVVTECTNANAPCGTDGERIIDNCVQNRTAQYQTTTAQRDAIAALCQRCPSVLDGPADSPMEACVARLAAAPRGPFVEQLSLTSLTDAAVNQISACLTNVSASGPEACRLTTACLATPIDAAGGPTESSCPADAGR